MPGLIVLEPMTKTGEDAGWVRGPRAESIAEGRATAIAGTGAIVVRERERLFAYENACPHVGTPLDGGTIEGSILTCPSHGFAFDVTSGECVTASHVALLPVPLRVDDGFVWVRRS